MKVFLSLLLLGLLQIMVSGSSPQDQESKVRAKRFISDAVCGHQRYNPTWDICCNGVVRSKPFNAACCGTEAYNYQWNICCGGVIRSKPFNAACCGTEAYNYQWNKCCNGKVC